MDIHQVRSAFRLYADEDVVEQVVGRWYDGSAAYDNSRRDTQPVDSSLPSINGSIEAAYVTAGGSNQPLSSLSGSPGNDAMAATVSLHIDYSIDAPSADSEVTLDLVVYYEDGFPWHRRSITLDVPALHSGGTIWVSVGGEPPFRWATGRHWIYLYDGDRKVAEATFEVTE